MDGLFIFNSLAALWFPAAVILSLSTVCGRWVVLGRMGRRRWAALVPVFSTWEVSEGASGNRALGTLAAAASAAYLLSCLLGFGSHVETTWLHSVISVAWLVAQLVVSDRLARAFGAGPGHAAALVILPFVGYPLLASESRVYLGPADAVTP